VRSTAAPYTESRLAHLVRNKCVGFPVVEQTGCSPCDEIKPLFLSIIRNFFKKFDGPMLCPVSLFRLGLETCGRHLSLCVGP
jgi:hypothetical protein